ncbi:DNA polymerase III subunit delta' [Shewanella sp. AS1]|uniref:DNA polymerase III subunit delta' n=1 Tax=Shewanella sp. AS1 TaxID=2907626 RepID=UPI001F162460|nr:DNA polymerase III subunit delta' [Shewanella sp. AS1]MCE9678345.1 DNA polymerase III subunit delta' [Shewanella sp. AS1]
MQQPWHTLPWHQGVIAQFSRQLSAGLQGHAYLVAMHQGYGALELTEQLAQSALCTEPTQQGGCGQCKSCHLFLAGNHPDYHKVEADGQQIKVDQIRQLCQELSSTAQQGGRRIAVIQHCERLNTAAANALLKTLEEPGRETLLFLQTDTPSRLMSTISSRCQRLHFQLPSTAEILQWLQQQYPLEHDVTWCLSTVGGPVELLSALESKRYEQLVQLRKDWIQSLSSGHLCANLTHVDQKQVSDALKVLFLVLKQKLIKQKQYDAVINAKITDFATKVMATYHELKMMPNVNYMAIFQMFILEYQSITQA